MCLRILHAGRTFVGKIPSCINKFLLPVCSAFFEYNPKSRAVQRTASFQVKVAVITAEGLLRRNPGAVSGAFCNKAAKERYLRQHVRPRQSKRHAFDAVRHRFLANR